jgi:hypothetical protein
MTLNGGPAATSRRIERGSRLLWGLSALPALVSAWFVFGYGVDVPFWDEWAIAPLLQHIDSGTLTLAELFTQHNEHRMLVPRVVQLAVAVSVGWDTRFMMWLTQGLLLAMMGGCIVLWRRSVESRAPWALSSMVLVTVVLFSAAQHQNFFWGFQFCFYLPGACLLLSTIVTSSPRSTLGWTLAAAATLSTIATFSILPGLLTWPLTAVAVSVRHGLPSRDNIGKWLLWSISCAGIVGLYFLRYTTPPNSPPLLSPFLHPFNLLTGVAACVGTSLTFGARPLRNAIVIGTAATGAFLWLLSCVWRHRADTQLLQRSSPWIVMGGFALLTALAIALGRGGYSYMALLESRYAAMTGWILISVVMLAAAVRDRVATKSARRGWAGVCTFVAVLSALGFPSHLATIRRSHHERLQSQAVYLFAEAAENGSPMVPPWLDWPRIKQTIDHLEQVGWRHRRVAAPRWTDGRESGCNFGIVEMAMAAGPRVMAAGWAFLPTVDRPADGVMVTVGPTRRIAALQHPLVGRKDIAERFNTENALVSGWVIDARPAAGGQPLEFWALDVQSLRAYRLCQPD